MLQVIPEPRLYTIRKPDGLAGEEPGGRRPTSRALEFSFPNTLQVLITYEQAQIASAVKLQVTVDGNEGKFADGRRQAVWSNGVERRVLAEVPQLLRNSTVGLLVPDLLQHRYHRFRKTPILT